MKVGILGSGEVGQTLAQAFIAEGHTVTVGTRTPGKAELVKWQKENPDAAVGTYEDAAEYGELIVLAVGGKVAEEVLMQAGSANLSGKIVIDVTNPIAPAPPDSGVLKFFTTLDESLMERLQKQVPDAKFVKAFNSVGSDVMYKPEFAEGKPTMFICGNDAGAKRTVCDILVAFGHEPEDMGSAKSAGTIESLCILWCIPGFLHNEWSHAFKLLRKK